jgi:hypothetical protein
MFHYFDWCHIVDFLITYLGLPLSAKEGSKSPARGVTEAMAKRLLGWQGYLMPLSVKIFIALFPKIQNTMKYG